MLTKNKMLWKEVVESWTGRIKKSKIIQNTLAELVNIHPVVLSGIIQGKRNPSLQLFFAIEAEISIMEAVFNEKPCGDNIRKRNNA